MHDYAKSPAFPYLLEETMAKYRIQRQPNGKFTISAHLTVGGVVKHHQFMKNVDPSDLPRVAETMAAEVAVSRKGYRIIQDTPS